MRILTAIVPTFLAGVLFAACLDDPGPSALLTTDSTIGNWTRVPTPTTRRLNAIDALGASIIAVGDSGTVIESGDGGSNWSISFVAGGRDLLSVATIGDMILVGDTIGGVWRRSGGAWSKVAQVGGDHALRDIHIDPAGRCIALMTSLFGGTAESQVYISRNAGATWSSGPGLRGIQLRRMASLPDSSFVAVGACYDWGDCSRPILVVDSTWTRQLRITTDGHYELGDVVVLGQSRIVAVGRAGETAISEDKGGSWSWGRTEANAGALRALTHLESGELVGLGSGAFAYRSTDRGSTWQREPLGDAVQINSVAAVSGRGAIAVGDGGVVLQRR